MAFSSHTRILGLWFFVVVVVFVCFCVCVCVCVCVCMNVCAFLVCGFFVCLFVCFLINQSLPALFFLSSISTWRSARSYQFHSLSQGQSTADERAEMTVAGRVFPDELRVSSFP